MAKNTRPNSLKLPKWLWLVVVVVILSVGYFIMHYGFASEGRIGTVYCDANLNSCYSNRSPNYPLARTARIIGESDTAYRMNVPMRGCSNLRDIFGPERGHHSNAIYRLTSAKMMSSWKCLY